MLLFVKNISSWFGSCPLFVREQTSGVCRLKLWLSPGRRVVSSLLSQMRKRAHHRWVLRLCSSKLVSDAHPVPVLELAFCNKFTVSHIIKSAVNCAVVMTYIMETILAMIKMLTAHWPLTLDHCLGFRSTFDLGCGLSLFVSIPMLICVGFVYYHRIGRQAVLECPW